MTESEDFSVKKSGGFWRWLAIGCGGLVLLAILGFAALFFFVQRNLPSMDGQKAMQVAQSLMSYTIPGGSRGLMSIDLDGVRVASVTSTENPAQIMLNVAKLPKSYGVEAQRLFERGAAYRHENVKFVVTTARTQKARLCGQPVEVNITRGFLGNQNVEDIPFTMYETSFNKDGKFYITVRETGEGSGQKVSQVFNSLRCR